MSCFEPELADVAAFAARLARGEEATVAGLGDSLTYGWVVTSGFFDRFIALLGERFPDARVTGANHGIPGDTAAGGLGRLGQVLDGDVDLLIIQFGLNDLFVGVSLPAFVASLEEIVERARGEGVIPVLATSCPVPGEIGGDAVARFYDGIRDCGERLDAAVADLERHWLDEVGDASHGPDGPLYTADGVHPTDAGHALMAEGLLEAVLNS
jgi:acyl-CoA thioesterase-1